jgi:hypothetical protein
MHYFIIVTGGSVCLQVEMEAAGLRQRLQESEVRVGDLEKQRKEQVLFHSFLQTMRWYISRATSSAQVEFQKTIFQNGRN